MGKSIQKDVSYKVIVRKIITSGMYILGGFFALLGFIGVVTGDYLAGALVTLAGLIIIPYVRDRIADVSKMPRIGAVVALVMSFVLLMVMGLTLTPPEIATSDEIVQPTPIITPNSAPIVIPTPIQIVKKASEILPSCTEIGDGTGWVANYKLDDSNGTAKGSYSKDNRIVTINVYVFGDKNEAMVMYYELHDQWGYDEYSPLEYGSSKVGELSMVSPGSSEWIDGCFTTNNIVVIVSVFDDYVTARDVGRYAGQVENII